MSQNEYSAMLRRRFRRGFRWFLWSLPVVFFLLALAAVFLWTKHQMAVNRLVAVIAEQDANYPGWRLADVEAGRATVPDDENGAILVDVAAKHLPKEWPSEVFRSLHLDLDDNPYASIAPELLPLLHDDLEAVGPALREARRLTERPRGRFAFVYPVNLTFILTINPSFTHIPQFRESHIVNRLLVLDALWLINDGDYRSAGRSCQAAINAGRALGDEPLSVCQLARASCVRRACAAIERLLERSELGGEELIALRRLVSDEMAHSGFLLACNGERATIHEMLLAMEAGEVSLESWAKGPLTRMELAKTFFMRDGLRIQHTRSFPSLNKMVEVAETPPHMRAVPLQEFQAMIAAHPGEVPTFMMATLGKMEAAFSRHDAHLRCFAVALAVEAYRQSTGNWPPSLEALIPKFLDTFPLDPADGATLRYHRVKDGVVIYSLCPDGMRNVYDPEKPSQDEGIAVRLWNVEQRGKRD